jgi:superfamily II DNA or RNA helicase
MPILHEHQQTALDRIVKAIQDGCGSAVGRVVIPTGGGKTFIEAATLDYQRNHNSKNRIHLVLAPRILLANQLYDDYRTYCGNVYRSIAFHSGKKEINREKIKIKWQESSTTRKDVVLKEQDKANSTGMDLVVFSTYHSCERLEGIEFDTIIADESQYCVSENFNDSLKKLSGRVRLFFTATERYTPSDNGRGLNNLEMYGNRLYDIKPAELIERNLIVPPRLHIMYCKTKNESATIISEVLELAKEQDRLTKDDLGFSKILFAMNGTDDVKTVLDNLDKIKKEMPDHDVFTITAKTGAKINGKPMRRELFIEKIREGKNCLIFHYDILSEGIDVDGITGVALMRNLGLSKLLQTIGRAVRIYKPNPALKKQAWISVPVINGNEDDKEQVKKYINAIRDAGYDISAEMITESGIPRHEPDEEDIGDAYLKYKPNFNKHFVTDILHEIEEAEWLIKLRNADIYGVISLMKTR